MNELMKKDFESFLWDLYIKGDLRVKDICKHFKQNSIFIDYNGIDKYFLNILIIEWLDSLGYYLHLDRFTHLLEFNDWYFILTNKQGVHLNNFLKDRIKEDCRKQATNVAVTKSLKIISERYETN